MIHKSKDGLGLIPTPAAPAPIPAPAPTPNPNPISTPFPTSGPIRLNNTQSLQPPKPLLKICHEPGQGVSILLHPVLVDARPARGVEEFDFRRWVE
ncbi:hypothetical protein Landi51_03646 [Colletotrichum acutatum]